MKWKSTILLISLNVFFWILSRNLYENEKLFFSEFGLKNGHMTWTIFVYMFIHIKFIHMVTNMITFSFLSYTLEPKLGSFKVLFSYIICGSVAGVFNSILDNSGDIILGSSGSIWGLIAMWGNSNQFKYVKYFIWVAFLFEIFALIFAVQDGISHSAHIGGFIMGNLLCYIWKDNQKGGRQPIILSIEK